MVSFLSVFPPYRGGIAQFSDYVYHSLQQYETVKAYNFSTLYPNLLFPGKSQTIDYQSTEYAKPVLHSYNPFNWKQAALYLASDNPDAVLYSHWHPFFAPALQQALSTVKKRCPATKIVGIAHNVIPHEPFPFQISLTRKLFGLTDDVVLLSHQTLLEFRALHFGDKYQKLFHPVYEQEWPDESRAELRRKYGFEQDETVLLFFGLVRKYKGLDLMIEALNKIDLRKHKIRPLIVGEFYTDRQAILCEIDTDDVSQYNVIDRFVSDEEAAEVMRLSDAMVLPYRSASQSGVLSNAVNFQLPVIVSDLPGLTEHIEEGETGLIFESNDVEALKEAILRFAEEDLYESFSDRMESLKARLSWDRFADALCQIIKN